jgi:4-hydroxybenzoate polyprenyltransferase
MAGNRLSQLTRSHEWWDHKTPQVLSLAYATAIMGKVPLYQLLAPPFLIIFGSLILVAIYASIINDLTDLKIDIACGKSNMMQHRSVAFRWLLTALSLTFVLAAAFFNYPNLPGVIFYLLIALAISLYSFPPFRLKKRGIWGVISCASAEHFFPTLFAVSVITYFSDQKLDWLWLTFAGMLSFCYGLRSILWHQFLDRENDQQSGVRTFASEVEPNSFKPFSKVIMGFELLVLAVVLYLVNLWISYGFLVLYIAFIWLKQSEFSSKIIAVISPKNQHFQILMLDFYTVFFPFSLLIYVLWTQPYGWLPVLIHSVLFHKIIFITIKDGYYLVKGLSKRIIS